MNAKLEQDVRISTATLRHLVDKSGNEWYCAIEVDRDQPLEGQACTPAEDWIYDRNFGG